MLALYPEWITVLLYIQDTMLSLYPEYIIVQSLCYGCLLGVVSQVIGQLLRSGVCLALLPDLGREYTLF